MAPDALNDGDSWISMGSAGFHAFSPAARLGLGWAVGENGRIARLDTATLPVR